MESKICRKCELEKLKSEFPVAKRNKDGLDSFCKACKLHLNTLYRRNLKRLILEGYGGKCSCCGEGRFEFLSIEHLNGKGREQRKSIGSHTTFYKWVITNGFPKELTTLCYNCNCSRGFFGYCPHKTESKIKFTDLSKKA